MTALPFESVALSKDETAVTIVDQTLLPGELRTVDLTTCDEICGAIRALKVRGAPAIGVAAAYGYYVLARQVCSSAASIPMDAPVHTSADAPTDPVAIRRALAENGRALVAARPTAVNLPWAVERMERVADEHVEDTPEVLAAALQAEAKTIHRETMDASNEISRLGASLLQDGWGVLTHCNAGPLGGLGLGTSVGALIHAHEQGKRIHVYADETRPLLQGARLTTFELQQAGVDVTLICDNMASIVMREGRVQACMVGCDRVAANGDVANKIGTSGVAILAAHYGIPFYVLGPTSTIDLACATGEDIPIELRDPSEIAQLHYVQPMAPAGTACYNPAFDVTDADLVAAIVTERGICRPPYTESLAALFS